jgi:hypothetical protein
MTFRMSILKFRLNNNFPWLTDWNSWPQTVSSIYRDGTIHDSAITMFCSVRWEACRQPDTAALLEHVLQA